MATLRQTSIYMGPSPWSDEPSVEALLVLSPEELAQSRKSAEVLAKGSSAHIRVPRLQGEDALSAGRFVVELARALLNEAGSVLSAASARVAPEGVRLTLGFRHPQASLLALEAALRLTLGAGASAPGEVAKSLQAFWNKAHPFLPDPQATVLLGHSAARGIPVRPFDLSSRLWLHGWGARSEVMFEASPRGDSRMASRVSSNKALTKPLAVASGFRTLPSLLASDAAQLESVVRAIGFPCVAKPIGGQLSKGVTVGIRDLRGLREAFRVAQEQGKGAVLVERHAEGEPYRLMVQRGKLWKAILRPRPFVVGDGASNVLELAKARNEGLGQLIRPFAINRPTPLDSEFVACLARQGLTPASVPAVGSKVRIREIPLLSKGASGYEEVTERVHPDVRAASERLAAMLGADSLGTDFIAPDIAKSEDAYFLEANLCPELRLLGMAGLDAEAIGRGIVGEHVGRVPSTLVIAPRRDHERLLALAPRSASTGWTDGRRVGVGASTFPVAVRLPHDGVDLLVRNPSVDSLLVLCDPEDLLAAGMPLDRLDRCLRVGGVSLPDAWVATLGRCSREVVQVSDASPFA